MNNIFLGLTGNIGGGKTTVLNLFKTRGFEVFNADEMVHQMFVKEHRFFPELAAAIDAEFGTQFLSNSFIDRDVLRPLLKDKEGSLKFLADLVKPFISQEILLKKTDKKTIVEVPLLFEMSVEHLFDKTIMVYCEDSERKRRIHLRNPNWTQAHIDFVMAAQMPQQDKIRRAGHTIYNNANSNADEQVDKYIDKVMQDPIFSTPATLKY